MATRKGRGDAGGGGGSDEPSSGRTQRLPRMLVEASSMELDVVVDGNPELGPESGPEGGFSEGSDVFAVPGEADAQTQPTMSRPQLIVLEEKPIGLCYSLARLGFLVRPAQTGVEAMSLVADRVPNAVVTGPGDSERRRVLVGALRLRFPTVPVVVVLPRVDDAVIDAARREGAHAVLSWPLPEAHAIYAAIPGAQSKVGNPRAASAPNTVVVPPTAALPPVPSSMDQDMISADASAELSALGSATGSMPQQRPAIVQRPISTVLGPQKPTTLPPQFMTPLPLPPPPAPPTPATSSPDATQTLMKPRLDVSAQAPTSTPRPRRLSADRVPPKGIERRPPTATDDNLATLNVARVTVPLTREGDENVETSPGKPAADVQDALAPRGDIKDVLLAVAPFLWGLDDCARYLEDLHAHHVAGADVHARTVRLVAKLLAQMQARVDEL